MMDDRDEAHIDVCSCHLIHFIKNNILTKTLTMVFCSMTGVVLASSHDCKTFIDLPLHLRETVRS
jgi:hypothetical protein